MAKNNARKKTPKRKTEIKKIESRKIPIKNIAFLTVVFILALAGFLFLKNSPYFKIRNIEVIDKNRATGLAAADLLKLYKGMNIFSADTASISSQIKTEYPTINEAIVRRILPDRLVIEIVPRIPVLVIRSKGLYPVDRTGMVLSPEIKTEALPVVTGFSIWTRPRVGQRLKNSQLDSSFSLLDALRDSSFLKEYNVAAIDASNDTNLSFYLDNGIEVKIGREAFPERLKTLKATLANPELDESNIKYIDLRFKDVVIGPR